MSRRPCPCRLVASRPATTGSPSRSLLPTSSDGSPRPRRAPSANARRCRARAVLLLVSVTTAPPGGELPLRKSAAGMLLPPVVPPTLGVTDNSTTSALGSGKIVSHADLVVSVPVLAAMFAEVALMTDLVAVDRAQASTSTTCRL